MAGDHATPLSGAQFPPRTPLCKEGGGTRTLQLGNNDDDYYYYCLLLLFQRLGWTSQTGIATAYIYLSVLQKRGTVKQNEIRDFSGNSVTSGSLQMTKSPRSGSPISQPFQELLTACGENQSGAHIPPWQALGAGE